MQILGEVIAILNSTYLLIRSDEIADYFKPGRKYQVFSVISRDRLGDLNLDRIYLPKGEVQIISEQAGQVYLAERFKEGERTEVRANYPSSLEGLFSKEIRIPGVWSASIDEESTLKIEIDKNIRVGDAIGSL